MARRCDTCEDCEPLGDGAHLWCKRCRKWTNLLDPRYLGDCLLDSDDADTLLECVSSAACEGDVSYAG